MAKRKPPTCSSYVMIHGEPVKVSEMSEDGIVRDARRAYAGGAAVREGPAALSVCTGRDPALCPDGLHDGACGRVLKEAGGAGGTVCRRRSAGLKKSGRADKP